MAKRAHRRYRRGGGTGWIYVAGAALAVVAVVAIIAIGAASRSGDDGASAGPPVVPTARPESVPAEGFVYGEPSAPVTVVEYLDFQCPICKRAGMTLLPPIEDEFVKSGRAKIEARPIAILGEESGLAAQGALCAADQGRFWAYYDVLFANQGAERSGAFRPERLKAFAEAIGLDTAAFGSCLDDGRYAVQVEAATVASRQAGVQGTPTFFVNGEKVESSVEAIRAAIEAALTGSQ